MKKFIIFTAIAAAGALYQVFPEEVLGMSIILGAAGLGIFTAGGFGTSEAEPY